MQTELYEQLQQQKRERLERLREQLRAERRAAWIKKHPGCAVPEHLRPGK